MTDRPILFSAPMVRALLAGTKTQTRRVAPITDLTIKPAGIEMVTWGVHFAKPVKGAMASHSGGRFTDLQARSIIASQFCPYGKPGDRLWVRETWAYGVHAMAAKRLEDGPFVYGAEGTSFARLCDRWRPSIHMPRAASRITLDITAVRVERLQDITEADALAEGIVQLRDGGFGLPAGEHYHCADPRQSYLSLWEAINGPGSVEANPWVWCVDFSRAA